LVSSDIMILGMHAYLSRIWRLVDTPI